MEKFEVGARYRIIGKGENKIRHFFKIGEEVVLERKGKLEFYNHYKNASGISQAVENEDVERIEEKTTKEEKKGNIMKYKVGDRIIALNDYQKAKKGLTGTVIGSYVNERGTNYFCIEFDEDIGGHDGNNVLGANGKSGHCWWFYDGCGAEFEIINQKKIVITVKGNETLARLYEDNKVIKTASAKCAPDDDFNFDIGARLAFDRLSAPEENKKDSYFSGKAVCIKSNIPSLTVGRIYDFSENNGRGKNDTDACILSYARKSIKDINKAFYRSVEFLKIAEDTKGE